MLPDTTLDLELSTQCSQKTALVDFVHNNLPNMNVPNRATEVWQYTL